MFVVFHDIFWQQKQKGNSVDKPVNKSSFIFNQMKKWR